jgi:tRNA (guanine9-N1)-methyltransferase
MTLSRKDFLKTMSKSDRESFLSQECENISKQREESERIYLQGSLLILDLSFTDTMKVPEINSMICQIRLSVGFLRKQNPQFFKMICAKVSDNLREILMKKGSQSWKVDLFHQEIIDIPAVQGKKIVFLSPDAEDVLDEVDIENSVYVVGGLVDKTVISGQSLKKAMDLGIAAARIPVKEALAGFADPFRLKKVLNINTVVEILHKKASGMDWTQTLMSSVPSRWIRKVSNDE